MRVERSAEVGLCLAGGGCLRVPSIQERCTPWDEAGGSVGTLSIALEEGFEGDSVVVKVNGRTVFEGDDVRTRMQIGRAERLEVPIEAAAADIEVRAAERRAAGRLTCDVVDRLYVGVSLQGSKVVFRTSQQPFGYV